jgi:hypothetical protein
MGILASPAPFTTGRFIAGQFLTGSGRRAENFSDLTGLVYQHRDGTGAVVSAVPIR